MTTERLDLTNLGVLIRRGTRDALLTRWLWLSASGFALLAAGIVFLVLPGSRLTGGNVFGRTTASLVGLSQLVVPLMGLTLGAQVWARHREMGTLEFLLTHRVSRGEVFSGMLGGLAVALLGAVGFGYGVAGLVASVLGVGLDPVALVSVAGLSWLLAFVSAAVGSIIGLSVGRPSSALGAAVFGWLALVVLSDLGLMGAAFVTRMPVWVLFWSVCLNPLGSYRLASLHVAGSSLDALGAAGSYAVEQLGGATAATAVGILVFWLGVAGAAGRWLFEGRDL